MRILISLLALFVSLETHSQNLAKESLRLSYGAGTNFYTGDLCDGLDCAKLRPQLRFGVRYLMNKHISWRSELVYFRFNQPDNDNMRNLDFRSDNFALESVFEYEFISSYKDEHTVNPVVPYAFTGISVLRFNPKGFIDNEWKELQPLATENVNYSRIGLVIPLGVGVRMNLPGNFSLSFDASFNKTFTDYLDDVSGSYVDNSLLTGLAADLADRTFEGGNIPSNTTDGTHWSEGTQRGSNSKNDHYFFLSARLNIPLISSNMVCPSDFWE